MKKFVISARPAPLPPRVSRIVRSPSTLPLPKKYTFLAIQQESPITTALEQSLIYQQAVKLNFEVSSQVEAVQF